MEDRKVGEKGVIRWVEIVISRVKRMRCYVRGSVVFAWPVTDVWEGGAT